jgi:hypothetical protein
MLQMVKLDIAALEKAADGALTGPSLSGSRPGGR